MPNNCCQFYLVRHGQTLWNQQQKIQGQLDSPLTAAALLQTKQLAAELADQKFSAIFSSDLGRARQTAQIFQLQHQINLYTTALLRERYLGILQGKNPHYLTEKLKQLLATIDQVAEAESLLAQENIEQVAAVVSRLLTFFRQTALAYPGQKVLVVSHSGVIRQLLFHLACLPAKSPQEINIRNLGYAIIDCDGVELEVEKLVRISVSKS